MTQLFLRLFQIREGEGLKSAFMFAYGFLIIASLSILKPVCNYFFLDRFGVEKLPYALVLMAFVAIVVGSLYARHSKNIRLNSLIFVTITVSILCLIGFWALLHFQYQGSWLPYAFYIWVAIFGVITGSQFWLLTNYIFNAREAKRLFGFIGAGAISGGIFGGYLTRLLAQPLKSENLIFFCIAFLGLCQILVWRVWRERVRLPSKRRPSQMQEKPQEKTFENPFQWLFQSRHLTYLAGLIGLSVVVASLVDYQFRAVASRTFEGDQLTAFFGFWASTINAVSLGIQFFLTGRITKYLGVTASLFFLPVGLFVGAVAILFSPTLGAAVLIKISDGGFKHSINKAATELLAFPIPQEIKKKARAFIDVFIRNFADGLGGILLILVTIHLGLSVQYISLLIIGLLIIWAFMILRVKNEYIDSFRQAIEKRSIDLEEHALNLDDATVFANFIKVLEGKNEKAILYILNLLEGVENQELLPHLKKLINHPSDEVKTLVLRMAMQYKELDLSAEAKELALHKSPALQSEAICYLYNFAQDKSATLKSYLGHEDYRMTLAALSCACTEWNENLDFRKEFDLQAMLSSLLKKAKDEVENQEEKDFIKMHVAKVIGSAEDTRLQNYLHVLINDKSSEVKRAAIESVGLTPVDEFVPILIEQLSSKHVRKYAREALAEYGEDIIDTLADILEDESQEIKKRAQIPKVFSLIGSQRSVDFLMTKLKLTDLDLRYQIIRALNKLRVDYPELRFDKPLVKSQVQAEVELFKTTLRLWLRHKYSLEGERQKEKKAQILLTRALEERLDKILERIFRLLGIKYQFRDMFSAYLGLRSDKSYLRANSIEFLDNVLEPSLKRILIPIVETSRLELLTTKAKPLGLELYTEEEALKLTLRGEDNWLKACTIYLITEQGLVIFEDSIQSLTKDPAPLIRETANHSLKRLRNMLIL